MKNIRNYSLLTALLSLAALAAFAWEAPLVRVAGVESVTVVAPPYDYEAEWIESHGTEYVRIDGGIATNDTFEAKFRIVEATNYGYVFGNAHLVDGNTRFFGVRRYISDPKWQDMQGSPKIENYAVGVDFVLNRGIGANAASIGGATYSTTLPAGDYWTNPYYIFAVNNAVTEGVEVGPAASFSKMRLYYFRQRGADGALKRDLVPVARASNGVVYGYLYDRVSKSLLGNAGTGAFDVGPAKAEVAQ